MLVIGLGLKYDVAPTHRRTPVTELPHIEPGSLELLRLLRHGAEFTRTDISERTGWARTTVQGRINELLELRLLQELPPASGLRGRPAARYRFNPDRGVLLVGDVGASGARLAVCNLSGSVVARRELSLDIADGPESVLTAIVADFETMLLQDERFERLWGVALSLPGPVEVATGRVISPPIMRGWDGYDVPARLRAGLGEFPVFVDNDATAMAWGERQARYPELENLLYLKIGTGVGAGIVANGRPLRGAQGAAGDIGHTLADAVGTTAALPLCRCGKEGCVEAFAGGWALARDLRERGRRATGTADILTLLGDGDPQAIKLVRDAGRVVGAALAEAVSLINPSVIVIGGELSRADDLLLLGIRSAVAARSLPLATRDLVIERSRLDGDSGVLGLADLLAERMLEEAAARASNGSATTVAIR